MPSSEINERTQSEWRELGFFYERNDEVKEWRLQGSKTGLKRFAAAMRAYAGNPKNELVSEHEHFGPYMYLELGTWQNSEITDHWIAGPLKEIAALAETVDMQLDSASVGDCIFLRAAFAPSSPYEVVLEVRDSKFDPAKADMECW
jgi:hypothetical protein